MSVALRFPLLSIRSGRMMGCGWKASGCGRRPDEGSRLLFTSPVISHMARSRSLLSQRSFSHTVLILSMSRVIELISLFRFLTMSLIAPLCLRRGSRGTRSHQLGCRWRRVRFWPNNGLEGDFGVLLFTTEHWNHLMFNANCFSLCFALVLLRRRDHIIDRREKIKNSVNFMSFMSYFF